MHCFDITKAVPQYMNHFFILGRFFGVAAHDTMTTADFNTVNQRHTKAISGLARLKDTKYRIMVA